MKHIPNEAFWIKIRNDRWNLGREKLLFVVLMCLMYKFQDKVSILNFLISTLQAFVNISHLIICDLES